MSGKDSKAGLKATGGPRKGRSLAEITADVENEMAQEQSGLPIAGRSSLSRGAGPVSAMNGGESGIDWLKRNGPNRGSPTPEEVAPQKSVYAPIEVGSLGSFQDGQGIFNAEPSLSKDQADATFDKSATATATINAAGMKPLSTGPAPTSPLQDPSLTPTGNSYVPTPQRGPQRGIFGMEPPERGGLKPAPTAAQRMSGGVFPGRTIGQTNAMVASNFPIQPPKPLTPAAQPLEPLQPNGKARRRSKSPVFV